MEKDAAQNSNKENRPHKKIFIVCLSVLIIAFALWQYNLHQELSKTGMSCGGDFSFDIRCPIGSSRRSLGQGPSVGGLCKPWFTPIFDRLKKWITQDSTFQMEINRMIGGGFMGATSVYLINSSGQVYYIHSQSYGVSPKKELIKKIEKETVKSLKDSLIKANIFEMEEGVPTYSGKSWRIIINGREKTIYFGKTPENLLETEKILKEILEVGSQKPTQGISPETKQSNKIWTLIVQNSGFPPNDNFIEGFWAYDMLTKYYRYPKNRIRFISTFNQYSDKWLELGGIETLNAYNEQKIVSTKDDIFAQPTKQNYIEGLKWLEEKSTKLDDVMIFSFAHGASAAKGQDFDTDNEYDNDDEYFVLGDKNTGRTESFYDGEFADLVAKIRAKNLFVWISACHGGGFVWDIIDRVQKSGNVESLYFMTQAIDERDVVFVKVPSINSPIVKFDWPDFKENFFGFLISGLTGLREGHDENGDLILKVNPPENRSIDSALQEIKDCKIDTLNLSATIGILEFAEGSKFPMKPAFGCHWNDASKTREYPNGEATLGYINHESMDFIFKMNPR